MIHCLFHVFHYISAQTSLLFEIFIFVLRFFQKSAAPSETSCRRRCPLNYLFDRLKPHNTQRSLRSSDKLLLDTPKIKTALAFRSFAHAAPSVWNSLPFDLRNSSSLHSY